MKSVLSEQLSQQIDEEILGLILNEFQILENSLIITTGLSYSFQFRSKTLEGLKPKTMFPLMCWG